MRPAAPTRHPGFERQNLVAQNKVARLQEFLPAREDLTREILSLFLYVIALDHDAHSWA